MGNEGMLLIAHDVVPGHEADTADWYNKEHHYERLAVPGFREALRYESECSSAPRFLCLYRTESAAVLSSPEYLARLNAPTSWTRTVMPFYRDLSRTVCEIVYAHGRAHGSGIAVLAISLSPPRTDLGNTYETVSATLSQQPGILRCRWLRQAGVASPPTGSTEGRLRTQPDATVDAAILLDVSCHTQAPDALVRLESVLELAGLGYQPLLRGSYRLTFSAQACT